MAFWLTVYAIGVLVTLVLDALLMGLMDEDDPDAMSGVAGGSIALVWPVAWLLLLAALLNLSATDFVRWLRRRWT